MDIKLELLSNCIADAVLENIGTLKIDPDKLTESEAIKILIEIKSIITNENLSDFEMVDNIVDMLEKHHIDTGGCHDF